MKALQSPFAGGLVLLPTLFWALVLSATFVFPLTCPGKPSPSTSLYRVANRLNDVALNIRSLPDAKNDSSVFALLPESHFFYGTQEDPKTGWRRLPAFDRAGKATPAYVNIGKRGQYASPPKSDNSLILRLDPQRLNPETEVTTLYSEPGYDYNSCASPRCSKVAWPHRSAELHFQSAQLREIVDFYSPSGYSWETFYQVEYNNAGTWKSGWIRADYFLHDASNSTPNCSYPRQDCSSAITLTEQVEQLNDAIKAARKLSTNEQEMSRLIADAISQEIGKCRLSSKKNKWGNMTIPKAFQSASANTVDLALLPQWQGKSKTTEIKVTPPGSNKPEPISLRPADMMAIDVLARTMYGEMAGCDAKHEHNAYSTAVAAMANNRRLAIKNKKKGASRFGRSGSSHPLRAPITDVLSSPAQFSVWNFDEAALQKALCPPVDTSKTYWRGHSPDPKYVKIWKDILATAVEAHLFPETFRQRTSSINGYFYTSRVDWKKSFATKEQRALISETSKPPIVQGITLSDRLCLRFWNDSSAPNLTTEL